MGHYGDDDLGASVLIYIAAIMCGFAVVVVPVLLASEPTVIANAGARGVLERLDNAQNDNRYPVAKLRNEAIVDPAITALLSAKNKATAKAGGSSTHDGNIRITRHAGGITKPRERAERSYAADQPVGRNTPGPFQKMYQIY
jgi:hypothetical protein